MHFEAGGFVHPIYREQMHALPTGWEIASPHPGLLDSDGGTPLIQGQGARLRGARELAERIALRVLGRAGHVRLGQATPDPGVELTHSAELLLDDPDVPYVVDFEHVNCFVLYQEIALSRTRALRRLRAAVEDERCRYLLPWCDVARERFLTVIGPESAARVAPKTITVPPAIRPVAEHPARRSDGPLRVLFVGTKFFEKGGVEAIRAVEQLSSLARRAPRRAQLRAGRVEGPARRAPDRSPRTARAAGASWSSASTPRATSCCSPRTWTRSATWCSRPPPTACRRSRQTTTRCPS